MERDTDVVETVETRTSIYTVDRKGVITQTNRHADLHTLADARANGEVFRRLSRGRPRLLLVDLRNTGPTEAGVREFYAELSAEARAVAMVIDNVVGRVIGNFYMAMKRPPTPTQLFTKPDDARRWLLTHGA